MDDKKKIEILTKGIRLALSGFQAQLRVLKDGEVPSLIAQSAIVGMKATLATTSDDQQHVMDGIAAMAGAFSILDELDRKASNIKSDGE